MTRHSNLARVVRLFGWRLLIVVVLAVAVSGATYAVALSPAGTAMSSNARRPPGKPEIQGATASESTSAGAPSATAAQASQAQTQRPPGGGRGPNLTGGLPELAIHAVVIGVIVLVGNGARQLWLTVRRRRSGSRAPVFRRVAAGE